MATTADASTWAAPKTLRLHVWGTSSTIPTLDPTSLYAASLLYAAFGHGENVKLELASASTSLPRVPLLQAVDDNSSTVEVIDTIDALLSYCTTAGLDSIASASPESFAKATALHALLDDQLLDLTLHSLFSLPSNYRTVTAPAYSAVGGTAKPSSSLAKLAQLPLAFQPSIPSRLRNVVEARLTAAGLWGLGGREASAKTGEADDLAARAGIIPAKKKGLGQGAKEAVKDEFERSKLVTKAREVLDVVNAALEAGLIGGQQTTSLDAHAFAYLAPLVFASPKLPIDTLPRLITTAYPNLAAFLTKTKDALFANDLTWASPEETLANPPTLAAAGNSESSSLWSYLWPFTTPTPSAKESEKASLPPHSSYQHRTAAAERKKTSASPAASRSSPEDRRLRLGRALWICTALIGLVGYTFASGISPSHTPFATHDPSTSCAPTSSPLHPTGASSSAVCPRTRRIVTGTFNSPSLFVLTYDALASSSPLTITQALEAEGPHQYLSLGISSLGTQTVYATTWGSPSALSSWHVSASDHTLSFGNRALITATGSYVHTQPPPYYSLTAPGFGSAAGVARWLGSAGGPTGELHTLDPETGRIGEKVKELVFLPGGEKELQGADKTRKALRYGAHSFDCSPSSEDKVAFVADLGSNSVKAYTFPSLSFLYEVKSKREGDGPRHSIPHPHLPLLFTVTEHTNYVDAYRIPSAGSTSPIEWVGGADMLLPHQRPQRGSYRGDTLRFSSRLTHLLATTRGKTDATKGLLLAYRLSVNEDTFQVGMEQVARFETRTSGGKANAIEFAPGTEADEKDLMILTDDEQGYLDVISFSAETERFEVEATAQLPKLESGEPQGASHAIWLLD